MPTRSSAQRPSHPSRASRPRRAPGRRRAEPAQAAHGLQQRDAPTRQGQTDGADELDDRTEQMPVVPPETGGKRPRGKKRAGVSEAPEVAPEPTPAETLTVALEPLNGPDDGALLPLASSQVIVGRDPASAAITADKLNLSPEIHAMLLAIPSDPKVSRAHLLLTQREDGWWARDLGSTNGTTLANSGRPIPADGQALPIGAALRIGDTRLRLVAVPASGAAPTVSDAPPSSNP